MRCFPRSTSRRNRSGENTTVPHIPVLYIRSRMIPARLSAHRSKSSRFGKRFGNEQFGKADADKSERLSKMGNGPPPYRRTSFVPCGRRIHGNGLWDCSGKGVLMWFSARMSGDVSMVSPLLITTIGRCSTAHAWARSFPPMCSTTISNGWKTYPKRNGADIPLQNFGSITVTNPLARSNWRQAFFLGNQSAGLRGGSLCTPHEEKRRPDASVAFRQNKYQPIYIQFLCSRKMI